MALPCCFSHCSCVLGLHACSSPWGSSVPPNPPVLSVQLCISMPASRTFCNFPLLSFQPLSFSPVPPLPLPLSPFSPLFLPTNQAMKFWNVPHFSREQVLQRPKLAKPLGCPERQEGGGEGWCSPLAAFTSTKSCQRLAAELCALGLRPGHCPLAHRMLEGTRAFLWALSPHEPTV